MHRRETNLLARSGQQVASHATQPPENLGKLPMAGRGLAPKGSFLARLGTGGRGEFLPMANGGSPAL